MKLKSVTGLSGKDEQSKRHIQLADARNNSRPWRDVPRSTATA